MACTAFWPKNTHVRKWKHTYIETKITKTEAINENYINDVRGTKKIIIKRVDIIENAQGWQNAEIFSIFPRNAKAFKENR